MTEALLSVAMNKTCCLHIIFICSENATGVGGGGKETGTPPYKIERMITWYFKVAQDSFQHFPRSSV